MTPFRTLTGIAAALPIANIDTDQVIPADYLKGTTRDGLGAGLFAPLRYDGEGRERCDFLLNREPWRRAEILVTLDNFGCGSSREHAPWALAGFGIRAILAPSFADIFRNNAFKNGLLPATLAPDAIARLLELAANPNSATFTVDLERQTVTTATGEEFAFDVPAERRDALLSGLDEIGRSLQLEDAIAAFEERHLATLPPIPAWPALAARLA
ncbi:3-isopropylmalate dehydratase small subunit [Sphingomonas astaxanthinifaciens]|uniref:3-isopropylmalate dehydratase small subunit n=1 Tax=Sphingomonas astaxanthinifaciens DSM 22298 TaxID=1123267 RepID=A0ABQ5Z2Y5_9SPHN|nr:3-isopropylmalate dehydratase small subunit [Sphingomonas astaxanthinifaciens]GLR46365.1 3-isopropylmalate dehydratase small subunit [Sphingomonas astaxanthinifaciens DSM 22298]